jgi:WD40 repeat protein
VPDASIRGLLLGHRGRRALLAKDGALELWDVEHGYRISVLPAAGAAWALARCPDGARALSSGDAIQSWDLESGKLLPTFGEGSKVTRMAVSPDGRRLPAATADWGITVWDLDRGICTNSEEPMEILGYEISALAISPDGRLGASGSNDDGPLILWDLSSLRPMIKLEEHVNALAFSADGRHVLRASWSGLDELDLRTAGRVRREFAGHSAAVADLALSRDGTHVVSASFDRTVRLWLSLGMRPSATSLSMSVAS